MDIFIQEPIKMFYLDFGTKDHFNILNKPLKLLLNFQSNFHIAQPQQFLTAF